MNVSRRFLWCVAVVGAMSPAGGGVFGSDSPEPKKVCSVEGINEYQLGNGMRVLLFPDPSKPTVTVNVTYFVGSRHEGYGETGMAHLLEHMVFKGTPDHPKVWKSLQEHGAQFNGTTSYDRTNYFETLSASDENLEFGLKLESDRMVNSFIAKKDLESEFSVVRNEFEMGENNPMGVLSERIWSTAYLWHNYGKSTIGSREDIERVPIERLQAFYKKYYQPDNAMLVVAGKFDEGKTLKRVNELFGAIPRPTRVLEKTYTAEPVQDGEREVTLRRVGDVQAIGCVYHICAGTHEDAAPLDVLADILDATQTGRLYKALVESELAVSVRAGAESLFDPGLMEISCEVRMDKSLDQVRKVLLETLDGFANHDVTDEEVDRAKNASAKQFNQIINDSGRVGVLLTEYAAMGDWRMMFYYRDQMEKVTASDVKRVAAQYLRPSNRTIGMFIPTKEPTRTKVPETPDIAMVLKDYTGREAVSEGEQFDVSPMSIEGRTKRITVADGMKVALLPKKTRGKKVNVALTFHYGCEKDLKGRTDAAGFIGAMMQRGTSKHSRRELTDAFDKLKATVNFGGGGGGRGGRMGMGGGPGAPGVISATIETVRENLPAVLQLVGEMCRDSTFPDKEFAKLKKQMLSSMEQMQSEPTALAMMEMRRRIAQYPKDDIRYIPTVEEQIDRLKKVELEDVKSLYKDFLGASYAEAAIIGDFDSSEITNVLNDSFKNWKSPKPFERIAMPYQENKSDHLVINTPDKTNSLFALGMNLEIKDDDADYVALSMANFLLGQNSNSRLMNRIRQKEGLSYGCGSNMSASSHEKAGNFFAFGICAPQNAEKAMNCAKEEIDKVLKDGFTEAELEDARKGYLEQMKVQMSSDGALAAMLSRDLYLGRTMKYREDDLEKVRKLTVAEVNGMARKYIDPSKIVAVRAGDFEKIMEEKGETGAKPAPKKKADDGEEKSSS